MMLAVLSSLHCGLPVLVMLPLLLFTPAMALQTRADSHIRLEPKHDAAGRRVFVDEYGRERIFHGVNAVVKGFPYVPYRGGFNARTSLVAEDFKAMQSAGLNLLRLGVMWAGAEPKRGEYNDTYFDEIRSIAREAAEYGIYTLADMHQDVLSAHFCGEGVPAWASQPDPQVPRFPLPLALHPFEVDNVTGYPSKVTCDALGLPWAAWHGAFATGSAYERLYLNHNNLTDAWGRFLARVATTFDGSPELLGIELINEPFVGNPWHKPTLMAPSVADRERLQPAYEIVAAHIRDVAPEELLFFAGVTWDRTGRRVLDHLPYGFTHPPGGTAAANRSVLAFHYYEGPQASDGTAAYLDARTRDAANLGTAMFLTEACCDGLFERAAPAAESKGVSWAHWEWKEFCTVDESYGSCRTGYGGGPFKGDSIDLTALRNFARPYTPAVAGTLTSSFFETYLGIYRVSYSVDPSIKAPTLLSLPELTYPDGYLFNISGDAEPEATKVEGGLQLHTRPGTKRGGVVDVMVCPRLGSGSQPCLGVM